METFPRIKRYMTPIPITIEKGASVWAALELMKTHGIRHLPVEENGKVVGILSDWDILMAPSLGEALEQTVADRMTPHPYCARGETPADQVLREMTLHGYGSVLVVDSSSRIIGIFTEKDALRLFLEMTAEPAPEVRILPLQ